MVDNEGRGDFLVSRGLISREELESALREEDRTGKSLGTVLLDLELVVEANLMAALAEELGMDLMDAIALRRTA